MYSSNPQIANTQTDLFGNPIPVAAPAKCKETLIVECLEQAENGLTLVEIAQRTGSFPSSLTSAKRKLEQRGVIYSGGSKYHGNRPSRVLRLRGVN